MNYRYYSLKTPKRHCACNHTLVTAVLNQPHN